MNSDDFEFVSRFFKTRSGLVLTRDKIYLLESRLMPVAREYGLQSLDELVVAMRAGTDRTLIRALTETMTINESFFFRDVKPFDLLRQNVLPALLESRKGTKSIRIWSAACSSGQEAYSMAITLREEAARLHDWRTEIVGTDISTDMIAKAEAGIYSHFEVQRGLPVQYLVKYFKKNGDLWQIDPALRAMVRYRQFNLMDDLRGLGMFDVVFCRNVLIYFDLETKRQILAQIRKVIRDDGALFLGGAETVLGISDRFQPAPGMRGIYRPVVESADNSPARSVAA